VISGFRRDDDDIYVLLAYYFLDFLIIEDGTDTISRNVSKKLPYDAA
jgi:hypothetical protein